MGFGIISEVEGQRVGRVSWGYGEGWVCKGVAAKWGEEGELGQRKVWLGGIKNEV